VAVVSFWDDFSPKRTCAGGAALLMMIAEGASIFSRYDIESPSESWRVKYCFRNIRPGEASIKISSSVPTYAMQESVVTVIDS
jgi:hypothetical protein